MSIFYMKKNTSQKKHKKIQTKRFLLKKIKSSLTKTHIFATTKKRYYTQNNSNSNNIKLIHNYYLVQKQFKKTNS